MGKTIGQLDAVVTIEDTDDFVLQRSDTTYRMTGAKLKELTSGGSTAGVARVLGPFPFAYNTPGINNGVAFYTPTVGDILLDAWIEVDTAFDGTTPKADLGTFVGQAFGVIATNYNAVNLSVSDAENCDGSSDGYGGSGLLAQVDSGLVNVPLSATNGPYGGSPNTYRCVPAKFVAANPFKLVVSQDGEKGGSPVGGTQGSGAVYLVVASPTTNSYSPIGMTWSDS